MLKEGLQFDGSKAERELGLTYTPIRKAIDDEISSHQTETAGQQLPPSISYRQATN